MFEHYSNIDSAFTTSNITYIRRYIEAILKHRNAVPCNTTIHIINQIHATKYRRRLFESSLQSEDGDERGTIPSIHCPELFFVWTHAGDPALQVVHSTELVPGRPSWALADLALKMMTTTTTTTATSVSSHNPTTTITTVRPRLEERQR